LQDFAPIAIDSEAIGPSPPAMLRVAVARSPDQACIVSIRGLRFEVRVATADGFDLGASREAWGRCRVGDKRERRGLRREKFLKRRCTEAFGVAGSEGQVLEGFVPERELRFPSSAERTVVVVSFSEHDFQKPRAGPGPLTTKNR